MWFYKIDGVLDGYSFPEDRGIRSRAAQEFQPKQTLFSKKVAGQVLYHRIADQRRKNHFGGGEPGILQHSCPVPGIPPGSGSAGKKT